jgi:hypothetical protein
MCFFEEEKLEFYFYHLLQRASFINPPTVLGFASGRKIVGGSWNFR